MTFKRKIEAKKAMDTGVKICQICHSEDDADPDHFFPSEISRLMRELNCCFSCGFWEEHARNFEAGKEKGKVFFVKGNRYHDGGRVDKRNTGGFLGYGGAEWKIRILATGEIIETNNLWHQGEIPEHYRKRMPDNAEFIHDEFEYTIKVNFHKINKIK